MDRINRIKKKHIDFFSYPVHPVYPVRSKKETAPGSPPEILAVLASQGV
jgi:hypothetical protein